MKVSKRQLRRIIREEKAKVLKEGLYRDASGSDLWLQLAGIVDQLLDQGMNTIELANDLRGIADDVEDSAPMEYDR